MVKHCRSLSFLFQESDFISQRMWAFGVEGRVAHVTKRGYVVTSLRYICPLHDDSPILNQRANIQVRWIALDVLLM